MSEKVCRICRQESWNIRSLDEYCQGLPVSILVMIICPIKIEANDGLPKFICNECVEVVISAYKLREESIDSDRFFRERVEIEADPSMSYWAGDGDDEPEIKIKSEQEDDVEYFADPLPLYSNKASSFEEQKPRKRGRKSGTAPSVRDDQFDFKVELYRQGKMKSSAWDYFGRLIDKHGVPVDSEFGFLYCKLCVEQKKSGANRYKCENISTGMIFTHLKNAHRIGKENEQVQPDFQQTPGKIRKDTPAIQGLTFSCMDCSKTFKMKMCLEIHEQLEHTGIADRKPTNKEYIVDLAQKRGGTTSMAWSYFGYLHAPNYDLIDDQHLYCRLCVGVGNLNGKYLKSCSTTTLLHHIRDVHLEKKRRKRFSGEYGESSTTPEKPAKQEIV